MRDDPNRALADEVVRLRSLLDTAQEFGRISVWERDSVTGQGRWSPQIFRLFGVSPRDEAPSVAESLTWLHPDDKDRVRHQYEESLVRPGRHETRYRVPLPDGQETRLHSIWQVPAEGSGIVGVLIDDTESVALGQQHQIARTHLELISKLVGMSLWRTDLATQRIFRGEQVWHVTGLEPGTAGVPVAEVRQLMHPDDLAAADRASRAVLEGTGTADAETRYRTPEGGWRTMLTRRIAQRDPSGRPVAVLGVGLDVTEQVEARERYRQLLEQFELVVEAAGIGLWSVDLPTGEQTWNAEMCRMYGLPAGSPVPPSDVDGVSSLVVPDDRAVLAAGMARAAMPEAPRVEATWRIRRPDGEQRTLVGRARQLQGDRPALAGVVIDVTELRRAEQAQQDKVAAEQANWAKNQFLSRMSHELRTPLNAVLGFTRLVLEDRRAPLEPRHRDWLTHVRQAGDHLLSLIDDVLDLTRLEAETPDTQAVADLKQALDDVLPWIAPLAEAGQVSLQVQAPAAAVRGDIRRWRQVWSNLLSNAVKYNRPGGQVFVDVRHRPDEPMVMATVRDTGRGMDAAQLAQLFQPFNRLGAEREGIPGTGIGLTVVRQIVQSLGGRIDVHSTPGQGTRVTLHLPRGDAGHEAGPVPGQADPREPSEPARADAVHDVVCVEDNPVNMMLVRELLSQRGGVRLHGAAGVAEAEVLIRRVRPALVLVDIHLPDGDGYELLSRLQRGPDAVPVRCVALSADAMPEQVQRALSAGFVDYMAKPIDVVGFLAAVDRWLAV